MIYVKALKSLEYDRILESVASFATLKTTKDTILSFLPTESIYDAQVILDKTEEAYKLLYDYSVSGIYAFDTVFEELDRCEKGGTLNTAELLRVAENLKGARVVKNSFKSVSDNSFKYLSDFFNDLYINPEFEKEIFDKIISVDQISDTASNKLFEIRKEIRNLNAKIRDKLNSYMRSGFSKYLQESVVTLRNDRYVIPVKSEYKSAVKGFVHDQSSTGSTLFIEPEAVLELNNKLKTATLSETEEINRILAELSYKITFMADAIRRNTDILTEIDFCYARAIYSFQNKSFKPILNEQGKVDIVGGKHPLINKEKVVPVSVKFGYDYNFILITGPNTGGKTVTLKLVGLFVLMAKSGLYLPTTDVSTVAVFDNVFCDIGDEQSIEQSLSTFSSHVKNIIEITDKVSKNSLILLDEIGAGTDPVEGSALALSVIKYLINSGAYGIITTHYPKLKIFAGGSDKIENASMEFDSVNLKPLYKLNVGIPGSSNALDIAKTLGLNENIVLDARNNLTDKEIGFEEIIKKAEDSRRRSEQLSEELSSLKAEREKELEEIRAEKEKIKEEKEKIYKNAKAETKRIVADKLIDAEEIIDELKAILKEANLESKEIFKASELKNRLKNSKYLSIDSDDDTNFLKPLTYSEIKIGQTVFSKSLSHKAIINRIKKEKNEIEVSFSGVISRVKIDDLYYIEPEKDQPKVKVFRNITNNFKNTINVIGKTSLEALTDLENFITEAVMEGLTEIIVVHGVGEGILLKAIREELKKDKRVKSFRRGNYGEGENGVTVITLK